MSIFYFSLCSPPPSLPNSQPPTREASPAPMMLGQNARTPPPKRWKRSFDMAHPNAPKPPRDTSRDNGVHHEQPLSLVCKLIIKAKFVLAKKEILAKSTDFTLDFDFQIFNLILREACCFC